MISDCPDNNDRLSLTLPSPTTIIHTDCIRKSGNIAQKANEFHQQISGDILTFRPYFTISSSIIPFILFDTKMKPYRLNDWMIIYKYDSYLRTSDTTNIRDTHLPHAHNSHLLITQLTDACIQMVKIDTAGRYSLTIRLPVLVHALVAVRGAGATTALFFVRDVREVFVSCSTCCVDALFVMTPSVRGTGFAKCSD